MAQRISLITPSYQQQAYLAECLASVRAQAEGTVEHIVVDGGSTDGSRELIERAGPDLAWWCSEADRGQSHALNKGLVKSTGTIFGWLNSDDVLLPGAAARVVKAFTEDPALLAYGGRRIIRDTDGKESTGPLDDAGIPDRLFCDPRMNQQSTFYRMDAVRAVGGVDEQLHYVMDLELWWRLLFTYGTGHLKFEAVDLAVFRLHEQSKTLSGNDVFRDETAVLLHGLAGQTGQEGLQKVLAMGLRTPVRARQMPLKPEHAQLVRRMAIFFLLKWHHTIYERWQFEMMRAFVREVAPEENEIQSDQQARWRSLLGQLDTSSWVAFRLRRKLKHLWS